MSRLVVVTIATSIPSTDRLTRTLFARGRQPRNMGGQDETLPAEGRRGAPAAHFRQGSGAENKNSKARRDDGVCEPSGKRSSIALHDPREAAHAP